MGIQSLSILQPNAIPFDQEELYNAAHARLIQLNHFGAILDLQYRGHCGGCTQHAILGAGLFGVLGHSLFVWKLIPVIWLGLLAYAGAQLLHHRVGRTAACTLGALLALPPPTFLELSLTAWGNHFESGVATIMVLWVAHNAEQKPSPARMVLLGLATAWALWIGFSSVFILPALLLLFWRTVSLRLAGWFGLGIATVGLVWFAQHTAAMSSPFETIYYTGESVPSLKRIPTKLWSLIAPRQLVALFGSSASSWTWMGGLFTGLSCFTALIYTRNWSATRPFRVALGTFLLVYCTVRFTVWTPPSPDVAPPGSMRYAAPIYGLVFCLLAAAFAKAWSHHRPLLALALIGPPLAVGINARWAHYDEPFPDWTVFDLAAPDFIYARDQATYSLPLPDHQACTATDPQVVDFHFYAQAWHQTRSILDQEPDASIPALAAYKPAHLEGIAAALLPEIDETDSLKPRVTQAIEDRIASFPLASQTIILAEAAKRRDWFSTLPQTLSQPRIAAFMDLSLAHSEQSQKALTRALGYQWASAVIRWRDPKPVDLPTIDDLAHPSEFVYGFGLMVGERWGPSEHPAPPPFDHHRDIWSQAIRQGAKTRWISPTR